jgi:predicted PurR-regulated permease PerM
MVPPLLAVLSTDLGRFWFVCVPTLALNTLVVNVVAPKVMSQSIGLHPVMVLAAVLIGARVAGPWGALFGVPVAAVIAAMASFYQLTVAERQERIQTVTRPPDDADPNALEHPSEPAGFGG